MTVPRQSIIDRHPESYRPSHQMDIKAAERFMLDIKEILDSIGVSFWLWLGTFLGVYRDGGLIPWDSDIDLAVYFEDLDRIVSCEKMFIDKGFELGLDYWRGEKFIEVYRDGEHGGLNGMCLSTIPFFTWRRSEAHIELTEEINKLLARFKQFTSFQIIYHEKNTFVCDLMAGSIKIRSLLFAPGVVRIQGHQMYDIDAFERPNQVQFLGQSWRIFSEPERWLEYMYGPDWRIPNKDINAGKLDGNRPLLQGETYELLLTEQDNEAIYELLSSYCPPESFPLGAYIEGTSSEVPIPFWPDAEALICEYVKQRRKGL